MNATSDNNSSVLVSVSHDSITIRLHNTRIPRNFYIIPQLKICSDKKCCFALKRPETLKYVLLLKGSKAFLSVIHTGSILKPPVLAWTEAYHENITK